MEHNWYNGSLIKKSQGETDLGIMLIEAMKINEISKGKGI